MRRSSLRLLLSLGMCLGLTLQTRAQDTEFNALESTEAHPLRIIKK